MTHAARGGVPDLTLYLVVGPDDTLGRPVQEVVMAAVEGGVTLVQLRWKQHPTRELVSVGRELLGELRSAGVPLIVNDRVDAAMAIGADGVHVGQEDMRVEEVRRLVGDDMLVGLSITGMQDVAGLDRTLVDYAGVGPVFAPQSKADAAPPLGLHGTSEVVSALSLPSVAIGGITLANATQVMRTGVSGLSVVSAISGAADPRKAAAELRGAIG